jgi:DNA-damage-inducible protein D
MKVERLLAIAATPNVQERKKAMNNETLILKAKDFATEITIFNAREHGMKSEGQISTEHITNNKAVRKTLLERGIRPESLPPAEDLRRVERRLASEEKKSLKNPDGLSEPIEE